MELLRGILLNILGVLLCILAILGLLLLVVRDPKKDKK
jgi:hypothetical protein